MNLFTELEQKNPDILAAKMLSESLILPDNGYWKITNDIPEPFPKGYYIHISLTRIALIERKIDGRKILFTHQSVSRVILLRN